MSARSDVERGVALAPANDEERILSEALEHISTLVRQISGARRVEATMRVHHDLGIAGDDATRLLQEMTSRFSVTLEGFDFARFFPSEAEAFEAQISDLIGLGGRRQPLTVQHLAFVLERRAWFDPTAQG